MTILVGITRSRSSVVLYDQGTKTRRDLSVDDAMDFASDTHDESTIFFGDKICGEGLVELRKRVRLVLPHVLVAA